MFRRKKRDVSKLTDEQIYKITTEDSDKHQRTRSKSIFDLPTKPVPEAAPTMCTPERAPRLTQRGKLGLLLKAIDNKIELDKDLK